VNFDVAPEQVTFAAEVEQFLDDNDDPQVFDLTRENMAQIVDTPKRREFMRKVADRGWLGMTWPKEWGGQDADGVYEFILNEALAGRAGRRSARASGSSARRSSPTAATG
jgi:3-oxocholest-4-en-26-oyl-CoA dehydrogenase alpha subunit